MPDHTPNADPQALRREAPILEHDPTRRAIIEPSIVRPADVPSHCVVCFLGDVVARLAQGVDGGGVRVAAMQRSEMGEHPLYELEVEGRRLAFFHPGVGAPLAAALLEEVIARGCNKFVVCGGCGVLDREVAVGHVLVLTGAVRDEGTSYHYLPPGREAHPSPEAVAAIEAVLAARGVPHLRAKAWTTDAFYRETPAKVALRRAEGCLAVEMEAAALFAVAAFRGVTLGQLVYAGDNLDGDAWDPRDWPRHSARERLFWLAAEACLRL